MRVILDANILLSALLSPGGAPTQIVAAWERNLFPIDACDEFVAELREVADRPFFRARLQSEVTEGPPRRNPDPFRTRVRRHPFHRLTGLADRRPEGAPAFWIARRFLVL